MTDAGAAQTGSPVILTPINLLKSKLAHWHKGKVRAAELSCFYRRLSDPNSLHPRWRRLSPPL